MPNYILLFGAGASYGSDTVGTPPLSDDLLDALRAFNPVGWGTLPSDLVEAFRGDFELGMRHLSETRSHAMPPLQRAMAEYFFKFKPRNSNLYRALADRIRHRQWNGALVTLNYDRLLEVSLLQAGLRPVVNMASEHETDVELCLPHGCCHLFCESVRGSAQGISMSGINIETSGAVIPIGDPQQYIQRIRTDAFPPVMSYFEPQKRTLSGASFIRVQRKRWRILTQQASTIALIGIRTRPTDEHIWDPLASSSAKLIYCSGSSAANEFDAWASEARRNENFVIRSYFAEAFNQLCEQLGLD